ncbi:type II toxin-antitoxin system RelE/ParE family toxin [Yersinia mollaretii]|uniref:type II toxin-antitoxin system RelE/ParE family toxin n=1 Tax=Yersinia mollaretii TaxID=33060 RepID=UPI00119E4101|nr:type II toxin-antitoxin system RelE/ParE family toxin [Yersinia mollaretii]
MRAFKTKWFNKAAKSHGITDAELCLAMQAVMQGKVEDLGGGVYKKRLNQNRDRSIILAKGGMRWVYAFLFAKQDMSNIDSSELASFRILAQSYGELSGVTVAALIARKELMEICHDGKE